MRIKHTPNCFSFTRDYTKRNIFCLAAIHLPQKIQQRVSHCSDGIFPVTWEKLFFIYLNRRKRRLKFLFLTSHRISASWLWSNDFIVPTSPVIVVKRAAKLVWEVKGMIRSSTDERTADKTVISEGKPKSANCPFDYNDYPKNILEEWCLGLRNETNFDNIWI